MIRAPTPPERLVDARGRPYFLWDVDLTLADWLERIRSPDRATRAYWLARALRDAKPDDVLEFVTLDDVADLWVDLRPHLGRRRAFWRWWLERTGRAVPA